MAQGNNKKATPTPQKLSTAKVALYGSILSLVGAVAVAAISNFDKFSLQPKLQTEEIIAFQDHQYDEALAELESRKGAVEKEKAAATSQERIAQLDAYLNNNAETRLRLANKHNKFKAAIEKRDYFTANIIKTDVNGYLSADSQAYFRAHVKEDAQRPHIAYCIDVKKNKGADSAHYHVTLYDALYDETHAKQRF